MSSEDPFDPPDEKSYDKPRFNISDRIQIMLIAIIIVFLAVLVLAFAVRFVFWLHAHVRWPARFLRRAFTWRRDSSSMRIEGLDSAILETLPMFVYEAQNFRDGLQCAVCQDAFQENEIARLLPNCGHSFHVNCIDEWLHSQSTCPLCRTDAKPAEPISESARIEQVSDTISERITSGTHGNLYSDSASSAEEFNLQNPTAISSSGRQKMNAEMDEGTSGGRPLTIKIPRRPDGVSTPVEAQLPCSPNGSQSSSRSPVTRLRSPNGSQSISKISRCSP